MFEIYEQSPNMMCDVVEVCRRCDNVSFSTCMAVEYGLRIEDNIVSYLSLSWNWI